MNNGTTIRLFVDAHVFDGEYQGTRSFIRELYNSLSANPRLQLFMGAYDIDNLKQHFRASDNIRYIKYKSRSSWIRLLFDIPGIIRQHKIDYAHFQYITPLSKQCKYIVTTHDVLFNEYPQDFSWWFRIRKNFLYRISAKKADILTTDSLYSKNSIRRYLGIDEDRISVFAPGISSAYFEQYDKEEAKQYITEKYGISDFILYVSRLEPRKNHALLLRSWLDLRLYEKGISLVIIGHRSAAVNEFDELINTMPTAAGRKLFLLSGISEEELVSFYNAARAFVYPSRAEGFGLPPLEAGALRVPVLCSNSTAMEAFEFFGQNHVDTADIEQFKCRLAALALNEHNGEESTRIATAIRDRYHWQKPADELFQLLENDQNMHS